LDWYNLCKNIVSSPAADKDLKQPASQVLESAEEYRPQGAGVLVNLNGQNALEAIDPQLYER
jgi:hypothetical protein